MKSKTIALFGVSVFLGLGYVIWAYSPLGKSVLIKWLIKTWKARAKDREQELDFDKIKTTLDTFTYEDILLMVRYTKVDLPEQIKAGKTKAEVVKKHKKLFDQLKKKKITQRFEIEEFETII